MNFKAIAKALMPVAGLALTALGSLLTNQAQKAHIDATVAKQVAEAVSKAKGS